MFRTIFFIYLFLVASNVCSIILQVPDYKEYIKNPMDFSTMRKKIDEHCYQTVADLAADFNLIIKNCMSYNGSHTIYYHAAYKLKRQVRSSRKHFLIFQ